MSKIHGIATIRINGKVYESEPDASIQPGGYKNNPRQIGRKYHYNQQVIPSQVVCKVPVTKEVSLRELQEIVEAEVTFESDAGRTWIIRNATQNAELSLAGGDSGGTVEMTFNGSPAEEMV